jgi:hypothetical protein
VPSPANGAITSTLPETETAATATTMNTTMKTAWIAMMRRSAHATDTTPMMLSTVTIAMATTTLSHCGIAGTAALR